MNYLQILNILKDTAYGQPNVNLVVREFLDLNREDTKYSAVVIQDRDGERNIINTQDYVTFTWHIGYVDRLCDDQSNRDHIFSTGISVINNIINSIRERYYPTIDIATVDKFNTFNQRFTAECAGVYVAVYVNVPISECDGYDSDIYRKLEKTITSNGSYTYQTNDTPWDSVAITVDVSGGYDPKPEEKLIETITANGDYTFEPQPGYVFSDASLVVSVPTEAKPEETLAVEVSTNGSYQYTPDPGKVYDAVRLDVDVHPSERMRKTYTSNGIYGEMGDFNSATITVSVPSDAKPEVSLLRNITVNGSYQYTPDPGKVFNSVAINVSVPQEKPETTFYEELDPQDYIQRVSVTPPSGQVYSGGTIVVNPVLADNAYTTIYNNGYYTNSPQSWGYSYFKEFDFTVDVHPSTSLVETITSNGTHNFTGEWQNAIIAVSTPEPKEEVDLIYTLTRNGQEEHIYPPAGKVWGYAEIDVNIQEESVVETITSNGSYHYDPSQDALINSVDISVDVHPSTSLIETITSNGTHNFTGEWQNATIAVSVPGTQTVTVTQVQYNSMSVHDSNTIYLILG